MKIDVVALGETMIRLTPPGYNRIEQSHHLEMHVGGSESNTLIGLSRLGLSTVWLSRLNCNPLGQLVASSLRSHGVDTSHVVWTAEDRVGTYFMERGSEPRHSEVFYDRADSAASRMQPKDLPVDLFEPARAKLFHTTGITLGISESARLTAVEAVNLARQAGWKISFDTNHRVKLWSADRAAPCYREMMQLADIAFLPIRDAKNVLGCRADQNEEVVRELACQFPNATIVLTAGEQGAFAVQPSGKPIHQPAFRTALVERLGGGDAFTAGFLSAYVRDQSLETALCTGAAAAAVKYTIPGDLPLFDRRAVERIAAGSGSTSANDIAR
ncbi:MAG: sugar kinase [Planctomycetales bacterium]|nr:sugar kinase [Planctomycetales bacterium]